MPKPELTATVETEVVIEPEVVACLSAKLGTYKSIKADIELLEAALAREADEIKGTLELHGLKKCRVDGIPICIVEGVSTKMDKLKFVALGGDLAMLKAASVSKPKKAYLKVGEEKSHKGDSGDAE